MVEKGHRVWESGLGAQNPKMRGSECEGKLGYGAFRLADAGCICNGL